MGRAGRHGAVADGGLGGAIEFSRAGDAPGSLVALDITLAGTSVGRGWDGVGHRPGTYRNRMRIEAVEAGSGAR